MSLKRAGLFYQTGYVSEKSRLVLSDRLIKHLTNLRETWKPRTPGCERFLTLFIHSLSPTPNVHITAPLTRQQFSKGPLLYISMVVKFYTLCERTTMFGQSNSYSYSLFGQ